MGNVKIVLHYLEDGGIIETDDFYVFEEEGIKHLNKEMVGKDAYGNLIEVSFVNKE